MSVNKKEKVEFTSPLQSLFKKNRFFTHYKPQFMKTATHNELHPNSRLTGFSHKQLELFAQPSRLDLRQSNSRSRSREGRPANQTTFHNNFYNYNSPNSLGAHNKKTSIDLDHSLKKNANEFLNLSKRLTSSKPNRPFKKMESFLNVIPKGSRLYHTMHRSNRNASAQCTSGGLLSSLPGTSAIEESGPSHKISQTFKLNGEVLRRSRLSKLSSDFKLERQQQVTMDVNDRQRGELFASKSSQHEYTKFTGSMYPSGLRPSAGMQSFHLKLRNDPSISRSGFGFGPSKDSELLGLSPPEPPLSDNKVLRSYENEKTKKQFYNTDKCGSRPQDFFHLLSR